MQDLKDLENCSSDDDEIVEMVVDDADAQAALDQDEEAEQRREMEKFQ